MGTKLTQQEIEKLQQKEEALKFKKDKEKKISNNEIVKKCE